MIFQSQGNRARHEGNRGEVLTKPIVQFLPETLLFAIADFKNFAFKAFASATSCCNSIFAARSALVRCCTSFSSSSFDLCNAASAFLRWVASMFNDTADTG